MIGSIAHASEILLARVAAVIGWPVPLVPIQLLWINLITDVIPALALVMEKPAPDVMSRRPRPPNELFFTRERGRRIIVHGLLIATVMIAGFAYAYTKEGAAYARAVVFYITVFAQPRLFVCLPQPTLHAAQLGLFTNPYLLAAILVSGTLQLLLLWLPFTRAIFFETTPLFGFDWLLTFVLALSPVSIIEIAKIIRR